MRAGPALSIGVAVVLASCAGSGGTATNPPTQAAFASEPATSTAPAATATHTPLPTAQPTALPGCLPGCEEPNLARPGALQAGTYQTRYFFGSQLDLTLPDGTWISAEDSTGELELHQGTAEDRGMEFWIDIYPIVDPTGAKVKGYDGTAAALVDWVAANPQLKVLNRGPGKIGRLTAEMIEFGRSPTATNVDPDCPVEIRPCVGLFGFIQWDGFFDQAGPFRVRLYAADVTWSGTPHAVYALSWAENATIFDEFSPGADSIIATAGIPTDVQQ